MLTHCMPSTVLIMCATEVSSAQSLTEKEGARIA